MNISSGSIPKKKKCTLYHHHQTNERWSGAGGVCCPASWNEA